MAIYKFNPEDARRFASEQRLGVYKDNGRELVTKWCPYCKGGGKDKNTFAINLETGAFNCKRAGCGAKGGMLMLAKDFGFSLGRDVDEYYNARKEYRSLRKYPVPVSTDPAVRYLEGRGISRAVTEKYNITTHSENQGVLVFPFFDEAGEMQFIKYRNIDPKPGQNKEWCFANCKPILFGMNHCDPENKTLVMTEGQIDSLSCVQAGVGNAVSVPLGAKGFTWMPYCWDFLAKYDTLVVFGDHEDGKITLLNEMAERFQGIVKHVHPDDYRGCKDANELLMKYGEMAVRQAVDGAVIIENPRIEELADVRRENLMDSEHFSSGIYALDKLTGGLFMGNLVVLTGERGKGKSTLASQIGISAINAGYKTFFYSGELKDAQFRDWFDRQIAGKRNIEEGRSNLGFDYFYVPDQVREKIGDWYRGTAFLYNNKVFGNVDNDEALIETLKCAILQYQCRFLIIDNLMTAMTDDLQSDIYRQQANFIKSLVGLAQNYNVLILLVAHPRKRTMVGAQVDNDDVAGSANITNLAHVVLHFTTPSNSETDCDRVLRVLKNRNTGRISMDGIPLWYEESSKRLSEHKGIFDWAYGWETDKGGFADADDYSEVPF